MASKLLTTLLTTLLALVALRAHAREQKYVKGNWTLVQDGHTGVSAMQFAITTDNKAIILDKNQHNPLQVDGHPAWAAELDLNTRQVRPLSPKSNTFCATGSFMSNGTLVSTAGNPMQHTDGINGLQAVRLFNPCDDESCEIYEDQAVHRLTSPRWYPSSVRLEDGSVFIVGGSTTLTFFSDDVTNNPTYEFYPPKNIHGSNGLQIHLPFLVDAMFANQFPIVIYLPDGNIFMACNQITMLFDWHTNTETRLPGIPNGVRISSPFSGSGILLPLTPENDYTPEVMICGGSTISDSADLSTISSQIPATDQCIRMVLNEEGIRKGWEIERLPEPRHMLDMVALPDQRIMILNGAQTGLAAWGTAPDQVGESNADHPAQQAVIYDPAASPDKRWSTAGVPWSPIPRLYHSIATLTPNGTIVVAGSAPNVDVSLINYPTEYRIEWFSPPYMFKPRPSYTGLPKHIMFGSQFVLSVNLPKGTKKVSVALIDLGFVTHGVHMDQRFVTLKSKLSNDGRRLTVSAPPRAGIYPPGPGHIYVVTEDGVPSFGHRTLIGDGRSPPVDEAAMANLLRNTTTVPNDPPPTAAGPYVTPTPSAPTSAGSGY